jgi:hypothetical protein
MHTARAQQDDDVTIAAIAPRGRHLAMPADTNPSRNKIWRLNHGLHGRGRGYDDNTVGGGPRPFTVALSNMVFMQQVEVRIPSASTPT